MSLILYEMPHSPFCIPVVRMLEAAGVDFQRVNVPNWDRRKVIELTEGRYYQVPVLEHDGKVVFESGPNTQDVAEYVDEHFYGGSLFPKRFQGLQEILIGFLENDVEGITFKLSDIHYIPTIADLGERVMVIRHKERKFGGGCVDAWRRDQEVLRAQAEACFARFEKHLEDREFLFGSAPCYTDFLLYGILGNYTFNGGNAFPTGMPALQSWHRRMTDWKL